MLLDNIAELPTPAPSQHMDPPTPIPNPLLRNGFDSISHLPVGLSGSTHYGQLPAPGNQAALVWNLEQRLIKEQQRGAGMRFCSPRATKPRGGSCEGKARLE